MLPRRLPVVSSKNSEALSVLSATSRPRSVYHPWVRNLTGLILFVFVVLVAASVALWSPSPFSLLAPAGTRTVIAEQPASSIDPGQPLTRISGTRLNASASAEVRRQLDCVGERGKWVYRPSPRPLPWEPQGLASCDLIWVAANSSHVAGPVANLARTPSQWTVRETLKYVWQVPGTCTAAWAEFNTAAFCRALSRFGGPMLMVGDSLTRHSFLALRNHLLVNTSQHVSPPQVLVPEACRHWEEAGQMQPEIQLCRVIHGCTGQGEGPLVYHVRNDRLTVSSDEPVEEERSTFYLPWLRLIREWRVKVLVLNCGVHFTRSDLFKKELEASLAVLRLQFPDLLVVYRATAAGHKDCQGAAGPLSSRQDVARTEFGWEFLEGQNADARDLVERHGGVFLDVEYMTALRPDGHFGEVNHKVDCVHYCSPGPTDAWVQMLHNALLLLSADA